MRNFVLLLLYCCLLLVSPGSTWSASNPPATAQGKPQAAEEAADTDAAQDTLPADPFAGTADEEEKAKETDQGAGETSWERLNSEREPEVAPSSEEEPPETFSPLLVWRMIRRLWSKE